MGVTSERAIKLCQPELAHDATRRLNPLVSPRADQQKLNTAHQLLNISSTHYSDWRRAPRARRSPSQWRPRRVTEDEIRASFCKGWRIDSLVRETMDIRIDPQGAQAWLCAMTRSHGYERQ
jgi:hypothetical protein